jgi:hypothetical protein
MLSLAEDEVSEIKKETYRKLERIAGTIERQKEFVRDFQTDYNNMVNKYLHGFNDNEILKVYLKINELEEHISSLQDINSDKEIEDKTSHPSQPQVQKKYDDEDDYNLDSNVELNPIKNPNYNPTLNSYSYLEKNPYHLPAEEPDDIEKLDDSVEQRRKGFRAEEEKISQKRRMDRKVSEETKKYPKVDNFSEGIGELYYKKQ